MESKLSYLILSILIVGALAQSEDQLPIPQQPDGIISYANSPTNPSLPSGIIFSRGNTSNPGVSIAINIKPIPKPLPEPVVQAYRERDFNEISTQSTQPGVKFFRDSDYCVIRKNESDKFKIYTKMTESEKIKQRLSLTNEILKNLEAPECLKVF